MNIIVEKPWDYTFYEIDSNYFVRVLCGGVGLYELNIKLNEEELLKFNSIGITYIDELVRTIQNSAELYVDRNKLQGRACQNIFNIK